MSAISLKNVDISYGPVKVVEGASIEVAEGESFALVGESGSGKSTILRAIAGLAPHWTGEISVLGQPRAEVPGQHTAQRPEELGGAWPPEPLTGEQAGDRASQMDTAGEHHPAGRNDGHWDLPRERIRVLTSVRHRRLPPSRSHPTQDAGGSFMDRCRHRTSRGLTMTASR